MNARRAFLFAFLCFSLASSLAPAQTGERHVLLEEFSTARCGFCPEGGLIAEQIVSDHPSVIWVTHHSGFGIDSMTAEESKGIASAFTNFAPSALIDRGVYPVHVAPYIDEYGKIGTTRTKWDSVITARLGDEQYVALTISSAYDAATTELSCQVDAVFSTVPTPGDIRMNLFLVEDSVIGFGEGFDQKNYYDGVTTHYYYKAGNPIIGYPHKRVVSAVPTGAWGVAGIVPMQPETGVTYTYTWSGPLSQVWNDCNVGRPGAISLVAFLSYYDTDIKKRHVIHAAEAQVDAVGTRAESPPLPDEPRVQLYPNPARGVVQVATTLPDGQQGMLVLCDAAGREITRIAVEGGTRRASFDATGLTAGCYVYRLYTGTARPVAGTLQVLR